MPSQKPTPEEKLFAVIQGAKASPLRTRAQALSLASLGGWLAALIGPLDLPRVNRALTVVMMVMGVGALSPFVMRPRVDRLLSRVEERAVPAVAAPLEGLRPLEEYLPRIVEQDPFRVGRAPSSMSAPDVTPGSLASDPRQLVSGLRLVGISWGEEPTAMIEQNQQTFFLKVGDPIAGFTVKDIHQDRVILRMGEQDVELF